ncbi:hypothetical protein PSYPI_49017, partial [Pseudomonas syringae pv. pisi str. 1704B]
GNRKEAKRAEGRNRRNVSGSPPKAGKAKDGEDFK